MILSECIPNLGKDLLQEILDHSPSKKFLTDDYIIKQGQVIRFLPLVINGSVKVFSHENSMPFLLYYVTSGETCVFSFAHIFNEEPVTFSAIAEVDSELLLLPMHKVHEWHSRYPRFSNLLLKAYQKHYDDLLQTTKQIVCYNLEDRLLTYLREKTQIEHSNLLEVSHQEIANDLGTSREVVTRLMKKLDANNQATQTGRKIKVL